VLETEPSAGRFPAGLTPRELTVLVLLAQGLTAGRGLAGPDPVHSPAISSGLWGGGMVAACAADSMIAATNIDDMWYLAVYG
jgi:hypothetical protein